MTCSDQENHFIHHRATEGNASVYAQTQPENVDTWSHGTEMLQIYFCSARFGINQSIKCKNICVGSMSFRKTV